MHTGSLMSVVNYVSCRSYGVLKCSCSRVDLRSRPLYYSYVPCTYPRNSVVNQCSEISRCIKPPTWSSLIVGKAQVEPSISHLVYFTWGAFATRLVQSHRRQFMTSPFMYARSARCDIRFGKSHNFFLSPGFGVVESIDNCSWASDHFSIAAHMLT